VWQITACDAASSYGVATILPALAPEAAASFLRQVLVPLFRKAGWSIQRVLTDGGNEFKAAFDEACAALGIRHTRTKPRHAWTNGFVERLQQTILHEHWRVEFRRRYFSKLSHLNHSSTAFCASTTTSNRITGTAPAAAHREAFSLVRKINDEIARRMGETVNTYAVPES
jgi:transposase InsO family protein